jgi:hypothetical protein
MHMTAVVDAAPETATELRVGSRVRFQFTERTAGLSPDRVNGVTGTIVRARPPDAFDGEWIVRLDLQDGTHGWIGHNAGDPDDPSAYCYSATSSMLVLDSTPPPVVPEPDPDVQKFKLDIYNKAMEQVRTTYPSYASNVDRWLAELNLAPTSVKYRISGELSYTRGRFRDPVPGAYQVGRNRINDVPELKLETMEAIFPTVEGETVKSLTAAIWAKVDSVVGSGEICGEGQVFVRRLGLRRPPRKTTKVELTMRLSEGELALLLSSGPDRLRDFIRDGRAQEGGLRLVESPKRRRGATTEPEPAEVEEDVEDSGDDLSDDD